MKPKLFNIVVFLITILELLKLVECGAIEVQDYELDYTNRNDITQMKFIFRLESGLGINNFLRLSFPFKIHTAGTTLVKVYYTYQGTNGCSAMTLLPAAIKLDALSTMDYLISFLDDINQPAALLASPHWYALYIYPEPGVLFTVGMQKPIQARTQSIDSVPALYGTPIIYDITNSFATLEFDDNPYTTLGASISISSLYTPVAKVIGAKYEISVIVKPQATINNGARIIFKINKDPKFKFVGLCVSEENSDATGTSPPLDSDQYTCTVDKENNRVIILVYAGVSNGGIYRFRVAVQNPNYVSLIQPDLEVRTMLSNSNKIIEKKIIVSALQVLPLTLSQKVIMGNGIDLSDATYPKRASVIAGFNFFNPFKFQFSPSIQTPDKVKLRAIFNVKIDMINDAILTGSIQHTFPRYDLSIPVNCALNKLASNYQIQCDEIGPLSPTKQYYVTARIYYNAAGNIDTNLGSVSLYTIDETTGLPSILIPEVSQSFASRTIRTNLNVIDTSVTNYGYQLVHTQTSVDSSGNTLSLSPIVSTNAGVKVCTDTSQLQKIVVTLNAGINGSFGGGTNRGMRLTTTPLIKAVPGSTGSQFYVESLNGGCTPLTGFPTDDVRMITTYTEYTDVLLVQAASSTSCMSVGGSTSTFSIGDVQVLSHSSSYAGRDGFDFYGALYSTYVDSTTAPNSYFAANGNTISMSGSSCSIRQLQNINIALSNYQTSSGGQSQLADGIKYPAFIRVTGYLTEDEKYQAKRIAIFFNNVDFYTIGNDNFGQMKVSCSSSMNPDQQCWGFTGKINQSSSVHSMKRVEFDVSPFIDQTGPSSPFQLLIPIKALPSNNIQRLQVAVLVSNPYYGHLTQAYQISKTMAGYSIITGSIAAMHPTLSDLSYQLIVSTRTQGNTEDAQFNIGHNLSVTNIFQNNPNSDPINIGAAFVIVGNWKMYTDTLTLATTSVVNTNVMSEHCLPFSYKQVITSSYRYGIYCPFTYKDSTITVSPTTSVTFNNFLYPAQGPLKLSGTFITWSQNTGALISVLEDSYLPTETLNANKITNVSSIQLRRYFKDNRVEWLFTTTNPFPKTGTINIKLDDSGNPWGFNVYTGNLGRCILYQQTGSFQETACTVSVSAPTFSIIFTFAAANDFPAANYKLVQYGIQSPSTSLSKTYAITISTQIGGGVIDQSNSASTLTFDNNVSWNTSVDNISFAFTHYLISNSVGNIDLFFRLNKRPVLALSTPTPGAGLIGGQYIQIQISQEGSMSCFVLKGGVTYFGFQSIDISNANQIRLFPRNDILTESETFQLRCLNVINQYQAVQTYSIDLSFNDGTAKQMITGSLSPTGAANPAFTNPAALTSAILAKYNNLAGAKYHYSLQLTFSTGITKQSSIFLHFPQKFDHKVGTASLHCRADNKVVYCINYSERCIQITAFPVTIAAGTQFTLEVYGINIPLNGAGAGNIQINLSTSNDPAQIVEQASILDAATLADVTSSFQIVSSTQTNTYAREQNLYQFILNSPNVINAGSYIYIEYPQEFGTSITVSPPTSCQILSFDDATLYGQGCTIFGANILITVSTSIPLAVFKIKIQAIINPEDTLCKITKIMISILSSDRTQVLGKSTISSTNQQQFRSTYISTLKYMNWYLDANKIVYNFSTVTINVGTYSQQITLKEENNPITRMISYDLLPLVEADFQLISDKKIYPGQIQEYLRIGCPSTTIPGQYTLIFTKTEQNAVATYGNLSLLNVIVKTQKLVISPEYTTYQIFAGGYSLPINFDLSEMLPFNDVSVQFTIVPGGTQDPKIDLVDDNNSVVPQYTLDFSATKPKGKVMVRSAIFMTATNQHWSKLQMTIFGTDASSYVATSTTITLQLISISPIPDFQYSQTIDQVSPSAIKQSLKVQANLPCIIFYHIRVANGPTRSIQEIMDLVEKYTVLNPMDYYQEQFGIFNYENPNLTNQVETYSISNLRSKMSYIITTWAFDPLYRQSDPIDFAFTTKNNNGRVMKIPIVFQKDLTTSQKNKISCFLCESFAIPCLNVMSYDSIYCSGESEIQLSIVDSVNKNIYRVLQQKEEDDNNNRVLVTSSTATTVNFYSLSIDQYEQDISWNSIIKIVTGSTFATSLAAADTTLPQIQSIGTPTEINQQTAPILVNLPTVSYGKSWIYIDKIETNINSLIWMYLVDVSNGGTPSKQQMKFKLTSRNKTTSTFQIALYDQVTPVSYNFTGLVSDKQYALYFLATTENPSLFAPTSSVSFVGQRTSPDTVAETTYKQILVFFMNLTIILIILL